MALCLAIQSIFLTFQSKLKASRHQKGIFCVLGTDLRLLRLIIEKEEKKKHETYLLFF